MTEKSIEHGSVISISTKNIFNVLKYKIGLLLKCTIEFDYIEFK